MVKQRTRVNVDALSPEERAEYEKKKAAARAPRPAYLVYKIVDGDIEIQDTTRSAEDALAVIDNDKELKYKRFLIK